MLSDAAPGTVASRRRSAQAGCAHVCADERANAHGKGAFVMRSFPASQGRRRAEPMTEPSSYRVTFYRELVGDNGRPCDSILDVIEVTAVRSEADAAAVAIRSFERRHGLRSWNH